MVFLISGILYQKKFYFFVDISGTMIITKNYATKNMLKRFLGGARPCHLHSIRVRSGSSLYGKETFKNVKL